MRSVALGHPQSLAENDSLPERGHYRISHADEVEVTPRVVHRRTDR